MHFGCNGKILRVNLSSGSWSVEEFDDEFRRMYLGGWGFIVYHLLKELAPGTDPLSPENKLIFANGAVTGATVGGSGRHTVGAKSPLTGGFGAAEAGGFFGAELAKTGFDAIVIEGKAPSPVYLWIHDGQVEIRPAKHIWGLLTAQTQAAIRDELGDSRIRVAQIGPAGEKMALIAAIMHDINRAASRTGLGAVMGSKNLKAVAIRGTTKVPMADPQKVIALARMYVEDAKHSWVHNLSEMGTAAGVHGHQVVGGLPAYNFQKGTFEGWEAISGETMTETILKEADTCFACPVRCKRVVEVKEGLFPVDPVYGGPEYESIGALGSICGVSDLEAIARANQLCNAYGMDTISTGVTIGWAIDCFERGLIDEKDTLGLTLQYGDAQMMVNLVELMGKREGFGFLLSQGSRQAARTIGRGTEEFAVQVKGLEVPMHEPRVKYGLGIGYAVSPTGADHNHNFHDSDYISRKDIEPLHIFGITDPLPTRDLSRAKMHLASIEIPWNTVMNIMGFCAFVIQSYPRPRIVELLQAITGWEIDLHELLRGGERAYTLARVFNAREGFTREDDSLPKVFNKPFQEGPSKGNFLDPQDVAQALSFFYEEMGWDENGLPTRKRLSDLGVGWAAEPIEQCGASQ